LAASTLARALCSAAASPDFNANPTARRACINVSTSSCRTSGANAGLLVRHKRPLTTK
jgi:hypothetical protein